MSFAAPEPNPHDEQSTRVKHPLLRLEVVDPNGSRTAHYRVFCRLRRASLPAETCCSCVRCHAIQTGSAPSVDCSLPVRPLDHDDDPEGESVEVGALMSTGSVALLQTAALAKARDFLRDEACTSVAVVDEHGTLVGVVHESEFAGLQRRPGLGLPIAATMSYALAVHERTPVRVALRVLAASHLREAAVVSSEGIPIGVFRDVDGLRWIAGTQTPFGGKGEGEP